MLQSNQFDTILKIAISILNSQFDSEIIININPDSSSRMIILDFILIISHFIVYYIPTSKVCYKKIQFILTILRQEYSNKNPEPDTILHWRFSHCQALLLRIMLKLTNFYEFITINNKYNNNNKKYIQINYNKLCSFLRYFNYICCDCSVIEYKSCIFSNCSNLKSSELDTFIYERKLINQLNLSEDIINISNNKYHPSLWQRFFLSDMAFIELLLGRCTMSHKRKFLSFVGNIPKKWIDFSPKRGFRIYNIGLQLRKKNFFYARLRYIHNKRSIINKKAASLAETNKFSCCSDLLFDLGFPIKGLQKFL